MSARSLSLRQPATFTPFDPQAPDQAAVLADYEGDIEQFKHDNTVACEQCARRWFVGFGVVDWASSPFDPQLAQDGEYVCADEARDRDRDFDVAEERFWL